MKNGFPFFAKFRSSIPGNWWRSPRSVLKGLAVNQLDAFQKSHAVIVKRRIEIPVYHVRARWMIGNQAVSMLTAGNAVNSNRFPSCVGAFGICRRAFA
ncbi:hypothetical protein LF1_32450 [Rubripirellula obstinata]|uniref:Uncharacterized protein n=1 Tax=Rubripirellula obstinata TaxID=406547 RepID=A0A5B1CN53_9BACT|nr:hypothetical protein LF1_32450 [Rubripirellula obstinata]